MPFYPTKNPKNQNFGKWKNLLKNEKIIWCTVLEIQSETDRIFCHFRPFFALIPPSPPNDPKIKKKWQKCLEILSFYTYMCTINEDHDIWFLKYKVKQKNIFIILGHFFALLHHCGPRKSKFWKNERGTWIYYHFTNVYHEWKSYDVCLLRYKAWQTELFVILDHFFPFTPLTTHKIKILKKWKKPPGDIITLHMCPINDNHMMYNSWNMKHDDRIFCHFGPFLPFYPCNNPKNQNFEKLKKTPGDIIILHMCAINDNHMMYGSWEI